MLRFASAEVLLFLEGIDDKVIVIRDRFWTIVGEKFRNCRYGNFPIEYTHEESCGETAGINGNSIILSLPPTSSSVTLCSMRILAHDAAFHSVFLATFVIFEFSKIMTLVPWKYWEFKKSCCNSCKFMTFCRNTINIHF